jgi:uncharacterized DUF497 family protein
MHFIVACDISCIYKKRMDITFDAAKDAANIAKHGVSLADFSSFDEEPHVAIDHRYDYGETRY